MNAIFSRATLLAMSTVVAVASLVEEDGRTPCAAIAKKVGVSPRVLEPYLGALVRGKILDSRNGPGGGYRLSRPFMTIKDIVVALDQLDDPEHAPLRSKLAKQVVLPTLREAEIAFASALDRIKVEALREAATDF